ncbi:hypothetical protein GCM10025787_03770 [Saccharopolyspora rosea]|uniref:Uncharacterized protein n=1 Tax=Saccharopolyspora rosea TaxID=524884 RepID=A0ABW3FZF6_9PSEU
MQIRITGTESEIAVTAEVLRRALGSLAAPATYQVGEPSRFYPNRSNPHVGRVYLACDMKPTDWT